MRYVFLQHFPDGHYYAARYGDLTVDAALAGPLAVTPAAVTAQTLLTASYGPPDPTIFGFTSELYYLDSLDNVLHVTTDLVTPAFWDSLFEA